MRLEKFKVVAIGNLNLREGPGEAFEIVGQVPNGYTMTVVSMTKDGGGHRWYKTDINDGWVKAVYAAQPNTPTYVDRRIKSDKNVAFDLPFSGNNTVGNMIASAAGAIISGVGAVGALATFLGSSASSQEKILGRRIYGVPHQFIDTTDGRPDDGGPLGLEFLNNIMAETPILSILPGIPDYLAHLKNNDKSKFTKELMDSVNNALTEARREKLDNSEDLDLKFFEFQPRCMEYMTYVNTLCRMAATFMGIDELPVPGYESLVASLVSQKQSTTKFTYGTFNWFRWHLSNAYAGKTASDTDFTQPGKELWQNIGAGNKLEEVGNAIKAKAAQAVGDFTVGGGIFGKVVDAAEKGEEIGGNQKILNDEMTFQSMNQLDANSLSQFYMDQYYIDFFVKPPSYSESFQNNTTTSQFANAINAASGMSKELQFLLGGAMNLNMGKFSEQINDFTQNQKNLIAQTNMDSSIKKMLSSLITGSTSVITGANIVFPEIWESSSYSRDFSLEVTLATPYGTRESVFLNIIVPMMHILALVLPRQVTVNSYSTPFLVRCTVPGFFTCDMGIVRDVSITKGGNNGDGWSKDGLPTEVTITINIADLYNSLFMSNYTTPKNMWNFIWNSALVDYVGTASGLCMRSSEMMKKLMVIYNLTRSWPSDRWDYFWGSINEIAATSRTRILGAKG